MTRLGRMDFAAGGGHPHTRVYECFEVNQDKTRGIMEESLEIIRAAWHDLVLESMKQFARDLMPRLETYHPDRQSSLSLAQY